jgi:cytochrome c-type biogenesis protein
MPASDLTLLLAFGAGIISFVSPCVLPLVPAYLAQLTVVAVVRGEDAADPGAAGSAVSSRWLAVRHALAYVVGFAAVFTLLGISASFIGGGLYDFLPTLRTIGGLVLIVMGLNLAGILTLPAIQRVLQRTWRPLEAGAAGQLARSSGTISLGGRLNGDRGHGLGERLGGRLVGAHGGWLASFGLGVVFAVGWTPCIGIILGGILTVAASSGQTLQGGLLLFSYSLGLGLPFVTLAIVYDRAPGIIRPLVRHGRAVSLVGGLLVAVIGIAMVFDWLTLLARLAPGV